MVEKQSKRILFYVLNTIILIIKYKEFDSSATTAFTKRLQLQKMAVQERFRI